MKQKSLIKTILLTLSVAVINGCAHQQPSLAKTNSESAPAFDAELSTYQYPFPVLYRDFQWQGQSVRMAYMDIAAQAANSKGTVVLLHGKNFGGFYFEKIARDLTQAGFRVIMPDQIGFGKSSKPGNVQYSFNGLAANTFALLNELVKEPFILVGHSMGGMLASRMALMEPARVKKLILLNPIGLEDYKTLTGYKTVDELYVMELKNSPEKIKAYQQEVYYFGEWKAEYDPLIVPAAGWTRHADFAKTAKVAALTSEMVYTQPVIYELPLLKVPTVMINGVKDKTAIGKAWAPEANRAKMGDYLKLGRRVKKNFPKLKLVELDGLGHVPFFQDYKRFWKEFVSAISVNPL